MDLVPNADGGSAPSQPRLSGASAVPPAAPAGTDVRLPSAGQPRHDAEIARLPSSVADTSATEAAQEVAVLGLEVEPDENTLQKRIDRVTRRGGLEALPSGFGDTEGDWRIIGSTNMFERLHLDWRQAAQITPSIVERHYRLLNGFWTEKVRAMTQGAERERIAKKYSSGKFASVEEVLDYPKRLHEAFMRLSTEEGIRAAFDLLDAKRREQGAIALNEGMAWATNDGLLAPPEMEALFAKGYDADLTDDEIATLIATKIEENAFEPMGTVQGLTRREQLCSVRWATRQRRRELERASEDFHFVGGSASSLEEFLDMSETSPEEAQEYLYNGYVESWIGSTLRIAPLAAAVRKTVAANEHRARGLELVLRAVAAHVGRPALPQITTAPAVLDFGRVPVGALKSATITLQNSARGDAWGLVTLGTSMPGLSGPLTFDRLGDVLRFQLDATQISPGEYHGAIEIAAVGLPQPVSLPVHYVIEKLRVKFSPPQIALGTVPFRANRTASVSISWEPKAGRLMPKATLTDSSPGLSVSLGGTADAPTIELQLDASYMRAGTRMATQVSVQSNAGWFHVPVSFRISLSIPTVVTWTLALGTLGGVALGFVRTALASSSPRFADWFLAYQRSEGVFGTALVFFLVVVAGVAAAIASFTKIGRRWRMSRG